MDVLNQMMNHPIIMTAIMGREDFAWANGLRCQYFPPERNVVPAHITLFHHLPPMMKAEIVASVKALTKDYAPPRAKLSEVMHLGRGVAFRVDSPDLSAMRMDLAEQFTGLLTSQDQSKPRFHITVQNKVRPDESKELHAQLRAEFQPRPLHIKGLALQYYVGGPWEPIGKWAFRGSARPG